MGFEIPMRDLRLMDPALQTWDAYAQILVRDNAMVVSIEHVRLILSADKVRGARRRAAAAALLVGAQRAVAGWVLASMTAL